MKPKFCVYCGKPLKAANVVETRDDAHDANCEPCGVAFTIYENDEDEDEDEDDDDDDDDDEDDDA